MGTQSEGTLVLELADVVAELTRRQTELLGHLRELRAGIFEARTADGAHQPPLPRFLRPPPPRTDRRTIPEVAPPPPVNAYLPPLRRFAAPVGTGAAPSLPAVNPSTPTPPLPAVDQVSAARHTTKRDYDYFVELDDLLARLPLESEAQDPSPPADE